MFPVDAILPDLCAALRKSARAVLVAPPGAGKTTRVPPALLDEDWARGKKLILLAPRRLAARAAAARMAAERGEPVGRTIGFRVRLESRVSGETRIEIVTEGVFTRMILDDPSLRGIAAVIFDEFHERSLEGDLGLALALDAQAGLREDLRLLVMSATLDAARVAALMDDAPVLRAEGRMFPITTRYRGRGQRPIEDQMADAARAALREEGGSLLCFLPGAREIERTARALNEAVRDPSVEIRPLYGAMESAAQDGAIAPAAPGRRKIVLASAIAETSLTIEGVRVVIDSGLARRPKYEPSTGLTRLETVRVSQAAAEQRRGRAGRLEPGVCWRLWDEGETRALIPFDPPEIMEADLSGLGLDLAAWGVADPAQLRWLDPPPRAPWQEALGLLKDVGALNDDGRLTAHGAALAALPLPPRLSHMVVQAVSSGRARLAARLAILLGEQGLGGRDADARERVRRLEQEGSPRAKSARNLADRIATRAGAGNETIEAEQAGAVLAAAFPERVAKARAGGRGEFVLANGRAAAIEPSDGLARASFLIVADLTGRADRAVIRFAAPLEERELERVFVDRIDTAETVRIEQGVLRSVRVRRLGRIVLNETPLERPSAEAVRGAILDLFLEQGPETLPWRDSERQLRARVALLRRLDGEEAWPDLSDDALNAQADEWLGPTLEGVRALSDLGDGRLLRALEGLLTYEQKRRLESDAPSILHTPAGGHAPIDYLAQAGPSAAMRLQEMFGVAEHPRIARGRIGLTITLLSPAHRPIQTTGDLPGFWRGSYADVRAEMRGRYPRHAWPEDPLNAEPTRRAKPRQ
ncbi:MAG TPA: ATP-dependent helicase HrpB [Caulobacterales bacterium]|nr:ATP-dependent helicase HrpB [Caulobacterales bacterium]